MNRASEDLLDALHGLSAAAMIEEIRAYQAGERFHPTKYDRDGVAQPREPIALPASVLAVAIKYLKDNGVDRPSRAGDSLDKLADLLPTDDEIDNLVNFPGRK